MSKRYVYLLLAFLGSCPLKAGKTQFSYIFLALDSILRVTHTFYIYWIYLLYHILYLIKF